MAQPIGDGFILGRRGRNQWRSREETVLFLAAEGANYCATGRKRLYYSRPRAQSMSQPSGD
eukprot:5362917-Pyramimonas_sp.AAC.1